LGASRRDAFSSLAKHMIRRGRTPLCFYALPAFDLGDLLLQLLNQDFKQHPNAPICRMGRYSPRPYDVIAESS
jgi:hypothetical protein